MEFVITYLQWPHYADLSLAPLSNTGILMFPEVSVMISNAYLLSYHLCNMYPRIGHQEAGKQRRAKSGNKAPRKHFRTKPKTFRATLGGLLSHILTIWGPSFMLYPHSFLAGVYRVKWRQRGKERKKKNTTLVNVCACAHIYILARLKGKGWHPVVAIPPWMWPKEPFPSRVFEKAKGVIALSWLQLHVFVGRLKAQRLL